MTSLDELRDLYRNAVEALIQGDPEPQKLLWARRDDVTLANPLGPPAKGWEQVHKALDFAASQVSEGEGLTYEGISGHETADLAYEIGIERCMLKLSGADEKVRVGLRVTTVFARSEGGWEVVHRHADPITQARPVQSIVPASADG